MTGSLSFARVEPVVLKATSEGLYEIPEKSWNGNRGQEFVIDGYTPGNPFDALIVGCYEGERLLYAAKVRNGFVPQIRRDMARRFKGLETATCPFANLPEKKRTQGL